MRFPRQEYWSGLPFPSPGKLPNPGINLHWQVDSLPLSHQGSPYVHPYKLANLWPYQDLNSDPPALEPLHGRKILRISRFHHCEEKWFSCDPMDCSPPGSSVHRTVFSSPKLQEPLFQGLPLDNDLQAVLQQVFSLTSIYLPYGLKTKELRFSKGLPCARSLSWSSYSKPCDGLTRLLCFTGEEINIQRS